MANLKQLGVMFALMVLMSSMAFAGPVGTIPIIGPGSPPIYEEEKFVPLLFMNVNEGGRVLFDDPHGFYQNGNITERPSNYIFTGEQIQWRVLVWDKNGVPEKINDVWAGWTEQQNGPLDPNMVANCQLYTASDALKHGQTLATRGYPNVRRPGDQEPQKTFNENTMGEYICQLTVTSDCYGQMWMGVKVEDIDGLTSTLQEAESWFCNPCITLELSGHDAGFGTLGPGEQGAMTFSVKNQAEGGVNVVLAISGKDFYDPNFGGGMCPTSNVLKLQGDGDDFTWGFWYTATKGSMTTVGPKRIPYGGGSAIQDADPIFSDSQAHNWKRWTGTPSLTSQALSPGSSATITLRLGLPQPCNGQFTDGRIDVWYWAI